jgi:membrane-associated phospholipid phosphatase
MNPYCNSCFFLFKLFDSCPRSHIFTEGNFSDIFLEIIWLTSSLLLPIIYASLVLFTIFRRTSRVVLVLFSLAIQQLLNELILKRIIAESRPHGACSTSYGLPSGHSAFAASFFTWLMLEWILFHDKVPFKKARFHVVLRTLALIAFPLIPVSRYFLNYHSVKQICLGVLVGSVCAVIHFAIVIAIIHRNEGKFWSSRMIIILKKIGFKDNFLIIEVIEDKEYAKQEDFEAQKTAVKEHKITLPLREPIRRLFWKPYVIADQSSSGST